MNSLYLRMLPLLTVMGIVFILSHQPGSAFYELPFAGADKLAHMGLYGVMAAAAVFAFPYTFRQRRRRAVMVLAVLGCLLFGISDEFHQSFVPGRDPSLADIAADTAGALLLAACWFMFGGAGLHKQCNGDRG